jgi:small basic protein (TIGR04137 family)
MSLDRSLKAMGGMTRTRSVLSRAERIAQLTEEGKFDSEKNCPFGLPKVRVKHSKTGGKAKKAAAAEAGAEGAAPAAGAAAPAAAGKAAPAAKGAAPAAKAAAPKADKKK